MDDRDDIASGDEWRTVRDAFDRGNGLRRVEPPSAAIVDAVSEATGRQPTDVPPLQHYVDADAIDALLDGNGCGTNVCVEFLYDRTRVTVDSAGNVDVLPENY